MQQSPNQLQVARINQLIEFDPFLIMTSAGNTPGSPAIKQGKGFSRGWQFFDNILVVRQYKFVHYVARQYGFSVYN
ncbi:hypothetical protein GCM10028808_39090 [Spirosoma migulaei]